jgi:uncharacterized protein YceH (UPF0502 family)
VHFDTLTPVEQRVLGCLIEKRYTTPDQYPLSLNALRLACNQSTNRDPVTSYDESTVREAAQRLTKYGLARLASGHSSRAIKWRHLAEEALGLDREQLSVLAVLLLRGLQTPGELKARTERMVALASLEDVERVLDSLVERGYVQRVPRRPGQKEDRYGQLLGGELHAGAGGDGLAEGAPGALGGEGAPGAAWRDADAAGAGAAGAGAAGASSDAQAARIAELEAEVASLRAELAALRAGQVGSASPTR